MYFLWTEYNHPTETDITVHRYNEDGDEIGTKIISMIEYPDQDERDALIAQFRDFGT